MNGPQQQHNIELGRGRVFTVGINTRPQQRHNIELGRGRKVGNIRELMLDSFFTQFLDALSFPRETTASTSTEAISDNLYTSHIPKASNVICPKTTTSKNVLRK